MSWPINDSRMVSGTGIVEYELEAWDMNGSEEEEDVIGVGKGKRDERRSIGLRLTIYYPADGVLSRPINMLQCRRQYFRNRKDQSATSVHSIRSR